MVKPLTKVVYKPDHTKTDDYIVIVNPEEYAKWKAGDTSTPITEVLDSFQVFHTSQGAQGILGTPSKQQLDNTFGTHKEDEVIEIVLQKGVAQHSDAIHSYGGSTNVARGSLAVDNKGKRLSGI